MDVVFVYWGRRGSLSWLSLEIAEAIRDQFPGKAVLSYSADNELAAGLARLAPATRPFPTFRSTLGAFLKIPAFRRNARKLVRQAKAEGATAIVVLMAHVWTPLLTRLARRAGLRVVVVVHETEGHPGDLSGRFHPWIMSDVPRADAIVTLTDAVSAQVAAKWRIPATRLHTLFHPAMRYAAGTPPNAVSPPGPLRVLFFGRIMTYKGLPLLIDAAERLAAAGVDVTLGVVGEGAITAEETRRLTALRAEIVNGWIAHADVGATLARYDIVVLPYVEASQSGVVAAAFGVGVPVLVTSVGGLAEQVRHEENGLIAERADAPAIAEALARLAGDRALLGRLAAGALAAGLDPNRSVPAFVVALLDIAKGEPVP